MIRQLAAIALVAAGLALVGAGVLAIRAANRVEPG